MDKTETKRFLYEISRNYSKNAGIMKINTLNNAERIIRKCLACEIETTVLNAAGNKVTIRAVSVPYTPEKQKDQTFHKLELHADFGAGEKEVNETMLDLETVLNFYDEVWNIACEKVTPN